jgi:hypothetical protein
VVRLFEFSQAKLGSAVIEIGGPTFIPVGAHGSEG